MLLFFQINQVFEILHNFSITKDWAQAMKGHLPTRKNYIVDDTMSGTVAKEDDKSKHVNANA